MDGKPKKTDHAMIRRLEAASFRSFPSTSTRYDGTWAIRLTAGHPAKRLNSVNPLDPNDNKDVAERIEIAKRRFASYGRPLAFRLTPLAPPGLAALLEEYGWRRIEESLVMDANITGVELPEAMDQLPLRDIGIWVDAFNRLSEADPSLKPGLAEVIEATKPETGLFLHSDGVPVSVVRCVHDMDIAGIFDLVTRPEGRRKGNARAILGSALNWARRKGARRAWLQVVADNKPAVELYSSLGFTERYRYAYWTPDEQL